MEFKKLEFNKEYDCIMVIYLQACLMPNGEIICLGKTLKMLDKKNDKIYVEK